MQLFKICSKPFSCGNHKCEVLCHEPGQCGYCPRTKLRTCPCGKSSMIKSFHN